MRLRTRTPSGDTLPGVSGTVRIDRRTGPLLDRVRPGDVAVIDHLDLDRDTAEALVDRGVVAVVNASSFISGRYPTLGPDLLSRAGVLMVDAVGPGVFTALRDGATVRVHDGAVLAGSETVASGAELGPTDVATLLEEARGGLAAQLQSLTHNTTELLRREQDLLLHGEGLPETRTQLAGRPVVVVVRGHDHAEELRGLRRFLHEQRPVLVGVDGGADALLAAGHRPDIVVAGSTVSDKALRAARDVVLHSSDAGGRGGIGSTSISDRVGALGITHSTLAASGTTEDMALLLADAGGASLIVTVGMHATIDELLDRQRPGLASAFATRLRVGPKLVDARSVRQLYAGRVRLWHLVLVLLAGLVAVAVAVAATPVGQEWWSSVAAAVSDVPHWLGGLVP